MSIGGAPPPCPGSPTIEELRPQHVSAENDGIANLPCPGTAIEGRGDWNMGWSAERASLFTWQPLVGLSLPETLAIGTAGILNQSTSGLTAYGLGAQRVNHAVQGQVGTAYVVPATSGLPEIGVASSWHVRLIMKETSVAAGVVTYLDLDDGTTVLRVGRSTTDLTVDYGAHSTTYDITALAGGWMLVDIVYRRATPETEVWINGVSRVTETHVGSVLGIDAGAAAGVFSRADVSASAGATVTVAFVGLALRELTEVQHISDATDLGVV